VRLLAVNRFWLFGLVFPVIAYFVGCKSGCDGIEIDGRCEVECRDELCPSGDRCFQNACSTPCKSGSDCTEGRTCEQTRSDHGTQGLLCVYRDGPPDKTAGVAGPCQESSECAERYGYRCVSGECTLTCEVHSHCGARGACTGASTDSEGDAVRLCEADDAPRAKGQFGTACPNGDECDADANFYCIGAGPGDIDAFCTQQFCEDDSACPAGLFCSTIRTRRSPCDDTCGLQGSSADDCVPAREIGPGKHYECGALELKTRLCLVREFCNECKTDADCAGKPHQICARDESGQKICTVLCDSGVNSCPWGSAAVCGLWDTDLGKETCTHRFGSCRGEGKSCQPCIDQTDCPDGLCTETQFTGERYCVDLSVSCSCPAGTESTCVGGGCPNTPAGKPLTCLGGSIYIDSPLAGKCLGAETDPLSEASRQGCWPAF
jgi:hypothetical protein